MAQGREWDYIDDPLREVLETQGQVDAPVRGTRTESEVEKMNQQL